MQLGAGLKELGALLLVQVTVPVGVTGVPPPVSVTVAVQVVGALTGTEPGVQVTEVLVGRMGDVTTRGKVPRLVMWLPSPG
ncbi:MAG TPA: hypothetical protein VGR25_10720 [bacterium]|jgi:hypothetical protein|nr:hypothetical protein [bacterium]